MRIIAGLAKGMSLAVPRAGVRPTSDRTREAIFSSLGERVVGATVLDLFAGTGALGLEAASRGARSVVFVESDRTALQCVAQNLESFRRNRDIACEFATVRADVFVHLKRFAATSQTFSLIFADPPYGFTAGQIFADATLPRLLADGGLFILESAKRDELPPSPVWQLSRDAIYGDTRVRFLTQD